MPTYEGMTFGAYVKLKDAAGDLVMTTNERDAARAVSKILEIAEDEGLERDDRGGLVTMRSSAVPEESEREQIARVAREYNESRRAMARVLAAVGVTVPAETVLARLAHEGFTVEECKES